MANTLLVHGYAVGIRFSVFRPKLGAEAGFSAFREAVANGEARVFRWDIAEDANLLQALNPWYAYSIYQCELARTQNPAWQEKLWQAMADPDIETVLCHSMGCRFVLETLRRFGTPPNLKRLVFVQGDVATAETLPELPVPCFNLYCPWDVTLLVSAFVHRSGRIGLGPWRCPGVQNVLFPLLRPWNVHTASIRSLRLAHWLRSWERVS